MPIIYKNDKYNNELSFFHINTFDEGNYFIIDVFVNSDNFSGRHSFSLNKKNICDFINFVQNNWNIEYAQFSLVDSESDSNICFLNKNHGHVVCYGILGGDSAINSLRFSFFTDQTCYSNLKNFFSLL